MSQEWKYIFSTSLLQSVLQVLSLHVVLDSTTLRTSLLLQRIITITVPEVLVSVIVHILSVSVGREVGKLVLDVQ